MKISVLGAGAWGTALARLLSDQGNSIRLWSHNPDQVEVIRKTGRNEKFLPGIELPSNIFPESSLSKALEDCELVIVAVPSRAVPELLEPLANFRGLLVSVTKGIQYETGLTMCALLEKTKSGATCVALSGPSFAIEVARGIPTACVAASEDLAAASRVQRIFNRPTFRVYTSEDRLGVELGGALKNVVAIAAGISDGLGFGDNSKAALVTRAIVEMRRLGTACGADGNTFTGLSGLGDLMATCFSRHSRNRSFGERVGRGENPESIAAGMSAVAEGYPTCRSAFHLAQIHSVSTPVIDETHAMLYEGKDVRQAVRDLMSRELKTE
jgi:glycerol-3-phosphate dehydrogenase (NAD(P)+)